jgi:hypothetical protein
MSNLMDKRLDDPRLLRRKRHALTRHSAARHLLSYGFGAV